MEASAQFRRSGTIKSEALSETPSTCPFIGDGEDDDDLEEPMKAVASVAKTPVKPSSKVHVSGAQAISAGDAAGGAEPEPEVPKEPPNGDPEDLRTCSICGLQFNKSCFPAKGNICTPDALSLESLQGILKRAWGRSYGPRYKALKQDKSKWRRQILAHKLNNTDTRKRSLQGECESLVQKQVKGTRRSRKTRRKRMTYDKLKSRMLDPAHGGYSEQQVLDRWRSLINSNRPSDYRGVVSGVTGHKRILVSLSSTDEEASVEEDLREFSRGKKQKREQNADDVHEFLTGHDIG